LSASSERDRVGELLRRWSTPIPWRELQSTITKHAERREYTDDLLRLLYSRATKDEFGFLQLAPQEEAMLKNSEDCTEMIRLDMVRQADELAELRSTAPNHYPEIVHLLPAENAGDAALLAAGVRSALGVVLASSARLQPPIAAEDDANGPDGPFGTSKFRYRGRPVDFGRSTLRRKLVIALWDKKKRKPICRETQQVIDEIYGTENDVSDNAFRQLCKDARGNLERAAIRLTIKQTSGMVAMEPRPL
jgi:hypothetical protein